MNTKTIRPADVDDVAALERRIATLEALVACPRCRGKGTITYMGEQDECHDCHGTKINRILTES